jgi:hypothetical protein
MSSARQQPQRATLSPARDRIGLDTLWDHATDQPDAFEVEPLPADSPLRRMENVVLTPHCAGGSTEAVVAMANRAVDHILAIRDGRRSPEGVLNPEVLAA